MPSPARALPTFLLFLAFGAFCGPAHALTEDDLGEIFDTTAATAKAEQQKIRSLPGADRPAAVQALLAHIEAGMAATRDGDAYFQTHWGDLYNELAEEAEDDSAFLFLDNSETLFRTMSRQYPNEPHTWIGLAESHCVRAELLVEAGKEAQARKEAEAGFAAFAEGEVHCPGDNYLNYMWGSKLAIWAYDVDEPERRILRERSIEKFAKAAKSDPKDQYALRMAGTANLRIAQDLDPDNPERKPLLHAAESWYTLAFRVDAEGTCSHLAEAQALLRDEKGLRGTLERCSRLGAMPGTLADDFDFVRNKPWFQKLTTSGDE